ncbi:TPA: hypothetical protein I9148_002905 [Clostridium perfringens]|nr:hypothetical protein [Clostridium perfringens]
MNKIKINNEKLLIAKPFLETEGIKMNKETTLKILSRQYRIEMDEALLIYNKWRREWCGSIT